MLLGATSQCATGLCTASLHVPFPADSMLRRMCGSLRQAAWASLGSLWHTALSMQHCEASSAKAESICLLQDLDMPRLSEPDLTESRTNSLGRDPQSFGSKTGMPSVANTAVVKVCLGTSMQCACARGCLPLCLVAAQPCGCIWRDAASSSVCICSRDKVLRGKCEEATERQIVAEAGLEQNPDVRAAMQDACCSPDGFAASHPLEDAPMLQCAHVSLLSCRA